MNKLVFGVEKLHPKDYDGDVWQVNGRPEFDRGNNHQTPYTKMPCNHNILGRYIYPYPESIVEYQEVDTIPPHQKYVYFIEMGSGDCLFYTTSIFKHLNQKVLHDCQENRCLIVLNYLCEGEMGSDVDPRGDTFSKILSEAFRLQIPLSGILVAHGNLLYNSYQGLEIFSESIFKYWIHRQHNTIPPASYDQIETLYLCLNRKSREARALLVAELYRNQLQNSGFLSFNFQDFAAKKVDQAVFKYPELAEIFTQQVIGHKKLVDFDNKENYAENITPELAAKSFVHVVTETHCCENILFFTEKIWKPILLGQPFFVLGPLGSLAELRRQGYRTYSDWFDESYDTEPDLHKRVKIIVAELRRLSEYSVTELRCLKAEMLPTVLYNQRRFRQQYAQDHIVGDRDVEYKKLFAAIKKKLDRMPGPRTVNRSGFLYKLNLRLGLA